MMTANDPLSLAGTTIGDKYDVHSAEGTGPFSVLYRATDRATAQPVAVKCFTALVDTAPESRDELVGAFVAEANLMAPVSVRNTVIVHPHDVGSVTLPDGRWIPYMVIEWLDGRTIAGLMEEEFSSGRPRRTFEQCMQLLGAPIEALAEANAAGVAHLDIRPESFFMCDPVDGKDARVRLLGFGVARVIRECLRAAGSSSDSLVAVSPVYAGPERFDPVFGEVGPPADVYAVASVLVQLMRGGRPPISGSPEQMHQRSRDPYSRPTPRSFGIPVSDEVEVAFSRALAVDVATRFEHVGAFYRALSVAPELSGTFSDGSARESLSGIRAAPPDFGRPESRSHLGSGEALGAAPSLAGTSSTSVPEPAVPHSVDPSMTTGPNPVTAPPKKRRLLGALAVGGATAGLAFAVAGYVMAQDGSAVGSPTPAKKSGAAIKAGATQAASPVNVTQATPPPTLPRPPCPEGMIHVDAGKFFMGTDAETPTLAAARPAHRVTVDAFCIDINEVTLAQYRACSSKGLCKRAYRDSHWPRGSQSQDAWREARQVFSKLCNEGLEGRDDHPVNCVTWKQAVSYCENLGKRLPAEKEWEFAARGSDGRVFPWGDDNPDELRMNGCGAECRAWRESVGLDGGSVLHDEDDGFPSTAPVGTFAAGKTQEGLNDIIGNVMEWTTDPFAPYATDEQADASSAKPDTQRRVIRGGAFNSYLPSFADPALRFGMNAETHSHGIGFRCAADPTPKDPAEPVEGDAPAAAE